MSDYNGYLYPLKDRSIKIFRIIKRRSPEQENEILIKQYQHPKNKFLKAFVRQIAAHESFNDNAHQDSSNYLIVVNHREGITVDCFIEFKDLVLKITAIDSFECRNLELKLTCQLVTNEINFDVIADKEWLL